MINGRRAGTSRRRGSDNPVVFLKPGHARKTSGSRWGARWRADLPPVRVLEVATQPAVLTAMDAGGIDLAILDGEAVPGGMGLCRQLKDEILRCPPILLLDRASGRRMAGDLGPG